MRMSIKLLILLLCISLVPVILLRSLGQHTISNLGHNLASETSNLLIRKAGNELKSLVEEHAKILKRERDLIEMALQVQVSELEKRYSEPFPENQSKEFYQGSPLDYDQEARASSSNHRRMWQAGSEELKVTYSRQRFLFPADMDKNRAAEDVNRLSSMTPIYRSMQHKHPDLIIWQITALDNGIQSIYPSMGRLPMMYNAFKKKWYDQTYRQGAANWTPPGDDPFTRQFAFVVSMPLHRPDKTRFGVTAIVVPVNVLLHEDEHLRAVSTRTTSFIVQPATVPAGERLGVKVIANKDKQPGHRFQWRASSSEEWLESEKTDQIDKLARAMTQETAGVVEMDYQGQQSIAAYGRIDTYGTALLLIIPKREVTAEALAMEQHVISRVDDQIKITGIILLIVVALVVGVSLLLSRTLTRNIQKMVQVVRRIASGDFSARVQIQTRDEMGELGETLNSMVPALEDSVKMKQALELAKEIQQSLLPRQGVMLSGLDIASTIVYCDQTGGDFYDILELCCRTPNVSGIVIGDVSDHGVSAALLMASARAYLRSRVSQPGGLAEYINDVNQLIVKDTLATNQFLTLFYLEIDPDNGCLRWVRAGHEPAIIFDPASAEFDELRGPGPAMGVDADVIYQENFRSGLAKGQILLLATDGVWDTRNPSGELFGKDRVKSILQANAGLPAEEMLAAILAALDAFRASAKQEDDITLVVIKIAG